MHIYTYIPIIGYHSSNQLTTKNKENNDHVDVMLQAYMLRSRFVLYNVFILPAYPGNHGNGIYHNIYRLLGYI